MNFLTLMIIYVIGFTISSLICFAGSKDSNFKIIRWLYISGEKVSSFLWFSVIPRPIRHWLDNLSDRFLYKRNPLFQIIYVILWLMVFLDFFLETDAMLRKYTTVSSIIPFAYAGFFVNLVLFLCCSWTNPGVITKSGYKKLIRLYKYDNWMFIGEVKCSSCEIIKPARSKHCAICNHCVHRFDHHCSWINNCVGARNVGYFIYFLLSITLQCVLIATLSTFSMWKFAEVTGLLNAQYLDANKVARPVNIFIIVQHLFMQRPFAIFIASSLWLLVVLTGAFTSYHVFLAITNQTTNERYKMAELSRRDQKLSQKNARKDGNNRNKAWFYNNGLWRNLKEVFSTWSS